MSSFEFLSVLISVVVGLGMANMFAGIGQMLHRHRTVRFSITHAAWSVFVFLMMVVFWWTVVYGWKDWENWNILLFLFILSYGFLLFLLSAILYPREIPDSWDTLAHFLDMRRWFFSVLFLWLVVELIDTYLKNHFDDFSFPYFFMLGSWLVCWLWGWTSRDRTSHKLIALWQSISIISWIVYQFRDLDWIAASLN